MLYLYSYNISKLYTKNRKHWNKEAYMFYLFKAIYEGQVIRLIFINTLSFTYTIIDSLIM